MLIDRIEWKGQKEVEWALDDGEIVRKPLKVRPNSVVLLEDRTGVMIIEAVEECGPSNLIIVNADGKERFRPKPPFDVNRTYGFAYGGYESGVLTLVLLTTGGDFAFPFNPTTGKFGTGVPRR